MTTRRQRQRSLFLLFDDDTTTATQLFDETMMTLDDSAAIRIPPVALSGEAADVIAACTLQGWG